jgi:hypothetical protein
VYAFIMFHEPNDDLIRCVHGAGRCDCPQWLDSGEACMGCNTMNCRSAMQVWCSRCDLRYDYVYVM